MCIGTEYLSIHRFLKVPGAISASLTFLAWFAWCNVLLCLFYFIISINASQKNTQTLKIIAEKIATRTLHRYKLNKYDNRASFSRSRAESHTHMQCAIHFIEVNIWARMFFLSTFLFCLFFVITSTIIIIVVVVHS